MNIRLRATLVKWDVTDIMTLNEVHEFCRENDVQARVTNGRVIILVRRIGYIEEVEE
jgi:hypothetical protein